MAIAFVFPGQGSQSVGMLGDLVETVPAIGETFAEASEALGLDLWDIVQNNPEDKLNQTEYTQPALLSASVALWRAWRANSKEQVAFMAGHSLGEYSALTCSGVIDFADAVKLVRLRGQLMQQAVPGDVGAMAAILGLEDAQVIEICKDASDDDSSVEAANFNTPGQVVVAGHASAVDRAVALASEKGAKKAMKLAVSVPSHCSLMKPAAEKLENALAGITFSSPNIPVVNNVDVRCESDIDAIRAALVRQLYCPVRWAESVQWLLTQDVESYVECGPGKVLAGLIKRINRRSPVVNVASYDGFITD
jgi:[acyl-carrier-protein] S-malonyltransferase